MAAIECLGDEISMRGSELRNRTLAGMFRSCVQDDIQGPLEACNRSAPASEVSMHFHTSYSPAPREKMATARMTARDRRMEEIRTINE